MIKQKIILEIRKIDRVYQLPLEIDAPLGEIFDVLTEMRAEILERINAASQSVKTDNPPSENVESSQKG